MGDSIYPLHFKRSGFPSGLSCVCLHNASSYRKKVAHAILTAPRSSPGIACLTLSYAEVSKSRIASRRVTRKLRQTGFDAGLWLAATVRVSRSASSSARRRRAATSASLLPCRLGRPPQPFPPAGMSRTGQPGATLTEDAQEENGRPHGHSI